MIVKVVVRMNVTFHLQPFKRIHSYRIQTEYDKTALRQ
jgi:hypothetical protein